MCGTADRVATHQEDWRKREMKFHSNGIYIVPDELVKVARLAAGYTSNASDPKFAAVVVAVIKWLRENPLEPLNAPDSPQSFPPEPK
jgi:hypothetical protein